MLLKRRKKERKEKMKKTTALFIALEITWGVLWAVFLQYTWPGRYLVRRKAWATVVIGVGGTVALARPVIDESSWWRVCLAFVLSSAGIVARSLANEQRLERVLYRAQD
jgi:hypothetical protein